MKNVSAMSKRFLAILLLLCLPSPLWAFNFAVGMYSGNGADNRDISVSPSFAIDAMLIKCSANTPIMRTSVMSGDASDAVISTGALGTNRIQSLGTGTFQVGSDASVNASGTNNCFYVAWGKDSNNDLAVDADDADDGFYDGNGSDSRSIATVPAFQPAAVFIPNTSDTMCFRFSSESGDNSLRWTTNEAANQIQAFNASGFEVGTATCVNENLAGSDYYPLSIKAISGYVATGSYTANTGTCADDCAVTAVGFQPDFVFIKGATGSLNPAMRTSAMVGDLTCNMGATNSCGTNSIQSLDAQGFTYGGAAIVNTNGTVYHWLAIKTPVYSTRRMMSPIIFQ